MSGGSDNSIGCGCDGAGGLNEVVAVVEAVAVANNSSVEKNGRAERS